MATNAEIRAWAVEQGIDCPPRGKIPNRVRDAHTASLTVITVITAAAGGPEETADDVQPELTVWIDLPESPNDEAELGRLVLELVDHAITLGRRLERASIRASLDDPDPA